LYKLLRHPQHLLESPSTTGIVVTLFCVLFIGCVTWADNVTLKAKVILPICRVSETVPEVKPVVAQGPVKYIKYIKSMKSMKKETKKRIEKDSTHQTKKFASYIVYHNQDVKPSRATKIAEDIHKVGVEFGVPPVYLLALAQVESSFDGSAVSKANCVGLLQVNPKVWVKNPDNKDNLKKAGILKTTKGLYNSKTNLRAGAHIFNVYYASAVKRNYKNPLRHTVGRYYGKGQGRNAHYAKFKSALEDYYAFQQATL